MNTRTWRRYGHDRTYFSDDAGNDLGWMDNHTKAIVAGSPEAVQAIVEWLEQSGTDDAALVRQPESLVVDASAVQEEHASPDVSASESASVPTSSEVADSASMPDGAGGVSDDLASRRPGQAAREQADSELAAMREKSRIATGVLRFFDAKTDERAWRVGASGEETVGKKLEKLRDRGWEILHSVPIGERGSDIDHMLIGPGGVWTINTKTHPGKKIWVSPRQIRVDGQSVPYLRNSEFEAKRVARVLSSRLGWEPPVTPALVFLTGTFIPDVKIVGDPEQVVILDRVNAVFALRRRTGVLTTSQVAEIFEVARRPHTWA